MKLLASPLVVLCLALLSGMGAGLYWFWQAAQLIVAEAKLAQAESAEPAVKPPEPWDFWTVELENLSRELTEERTKLAQREAELLRREQRVAAERGEVDAVLRQVETMRAQISEQIVSVQREEMRNLKNLSATYALLSPGAAVAIFDELDDLMVTKLLSLMKAEPASAILEEMAKAGPPDDRRVKRAAELSQRLRLLVSAK